MSGTCSRRSLLGAGTAALVLPWLESRSGVARAAAVAAPTRLVCFYVPNGMPMDAWHAPPGDPEALSEMLSPLAPLRGQVSVITGLANAPAELEGAGNHASGTAGFLTAARAQRSDHAPVIGVSLDQRYAQHLGAVTPWSSLQLGLEGGGAAGNCDNGFACAYSRNISWSDATTPLPKLTDPRVVFELLFAGAAGSQAEREARLALRRSVLDGVLAQTRSLERELGHEDRTRLDGWYESVRAIERRLDTPPPRCELGSFDGGYLDVDGHARAMNELMVLALRCESTRVISFMLGNSASDRPCSFLGIDGTHHALSHHTGDPEKLAALAIIGRWELECFADLLARMAAVDEGDGSLLDHAAVLFGSELSDPNAHRHDDLPLLLAGRASGALAPGSTIAYPDRRPLGDLHLALLQRLGVELDRFGDDGRVPLETL